VRDIDVLLRSALQAFNLSLTAEDNAWLNIPAVGREFGSADYERLSKLDLETRPKSEQI